MSNDIVSSNKKYRCNSLIRVEESTELCRGSCRVGRRFACFYMGWNEEEISRIGVNWMAWHVGKKYIVIIIVRLSIFDEIHRVGSAALVDYVDIRSYEEVCHRLIPDFIQRVTVAGIFDVIVVFKAFLALPDVDFAQEHGVN